MRLLLDSHSFVWAKAGGRALSDDVLSAIAEAEKVFVSVASAWELWIKHNKKPIARILDGGPSAFAAAANESGIELLEMTLSHAAAAAALPLHHRDPFDRMIIAQALREGLTLVSRDRIFDRYAGLRILKI